MKPILTLTIASIWAPVLWSAQLSVTPSQYLPGGYATITGSGAGPCEASANPAYSPWSGSKGPDIGQSVAPDVTTVFTLTCADGSASATLTVGNTPAPPAVQLAGRAPVCFPDVTLPVKAVTVAVDPVVFDGDTHLTAWTCQTATGYANQRWSWKVSDIASFLFQASAGTLNETEARAWSVAHGVAPTLASFARSRELLAQYEASAVVAANGTATTRPVYPLNADGTRGTVAVAGVRAAVGSPCDIGKRVGTTSYYAVTGGVTLCKFTAPIGVNQ